MILGLYLMTEKGLAVLEAALETGIPISQVTTAPARGMADDSHKTISRLAKSHGIPTFEHAHPPSYTGEWSIAAGWRWMLHNPRRSLIVLHDSLLPRYRGHSPLITALINGERTVGVTAFLAEEEPDTGPIIEMRALMLTYPLKMRQVLDSLVPLYGDLTKVVCSQIAAGEVKTSPQDHDKATYSIWRDEHDYRIFWRLDAMRIQRHIHACGDPFPGAWTKTANGKRVTVLDAEIADDLRIEDRRPGKVAFERDGDPIVVCGYGMLRLTEWSCPGDLSLGHTRLR